MLALYTKDVTVAGYYLYTNMCTMSITFDDQVPEPTTLRERRMQEKEISIERMLLSLGIVKDRQQASKLAVFLGVTIIIACCVVIFTLIRPEPIDESRYYDPITGEPVYASSR